MPGEVALLAVRNFQAFLCFGRGYFEPFWYLRFIWLLCLSGISAAKQKQFSKSCPTGKSFGRAYFYLMQNGGERSTRLIVRKSFARRSAWCAICSCWFAKNYIFYGNLNGCLEIIDTFANQSNKKVIICKD